MNNLSSHLTSNARFSKALSGLVFCLWFSGLGCNKSEAQKVDKAKVSEKKEEIPDNFSMNPMFAGKEKEPAPSENGKSAKAGADEAGAQLSSDPVLLSPGTDPKERKYAFSVGKTEARTVIVNAQMMRSGKVQGVQPPLTVKLQFTCKSKSPQGFVFAATVAKVDVSLQGADPQLKAQASQMTKALALLSGLTVTFTASPSGGVSDFNVDAASVKEPQAAQMILQPLTQILDVLVPVLPKQAVGAGGKWQLVRKDPSAGVSVVSTYTLDSVTGSEAKLLVDVEQTSPKRPVQEQNAPPGTTLSIEGKGKYTYALGFDKLPGAITGELASKQVIEIPGKPAMSEETKTTLVFQNTK